ncbi:MAG: aminotransferase [Acidimicrobiales bacterium]|nr:MAG: aminotransferase [Acidimicrobiales bacterium]
MPRGSLVTMEFRRITSLPPYVFTIIDSLKIEARRAGVDVIDLGFGNPDLPSPETAVAKLCEAARNPRNHRYSSSRGIPRLREAVSEMYRRRFGVELDPETEVIQTIGAKEGFSHLMWVLLQPGDAALVPSPSYPIHIYGPLFAGADIREVPLGTENEFLDSLREAYEYSWPKPRVIVISFPHNPTTTCVELPFFQRVVDFAREHEVVVVHDNAYADLGFDGFRPPSILQAEGAKEVAVELYSMTKSYSMAGWRVAFLVGNKDVVAALAKLKSYLDYGTFQPIQIAATVTLNQEPDFPERMCEIYQRRRDALCRGLNRIGWKVDPPRGTMFVWAPIPEPYRDLGSVDFCKKLVQEARVAASPGVGFGPGGDGFVRFALIENEQRINQAVRNIKRALVDLEAP